MAQLSKYLNALKINHATFVKLSAEQKTEIKRQHVKQLELHRKYTYGSASIAFLENADGILEINIKAEREKLERIHDEAIAEVREAIKQEVERIRASQAEKRHRLRLKTSVTVPAEKASAMQVALSAAKTVDEVMHLHADALSANDEPAAFWLEQNAGAHIQKIGKEVDQARWEDLCQREYRRRGGAVLREIEEVEEVIRSAESTAHRYRTTTEAQDMIAKFGGAVDDWIGLTD